jgi:hypothetical protein
VQLLGLFKRSISPVLAIVAKMNILACIWSLTLILAIVAKMNSLAFKKGQ